MWSNRFNKKIIRKKPTGIKLSLRLITGGKNESGYRND